MVLHLSLTIVPLVWKELLWVQLLRYLVIYRIAWKEIHTLNVKVMKVGVVWQNVVSIADIYILLQQHPHGVE